MWVLIREKFKKYDVRTARCYRKVFFMRIVAVRYTSDFSIGFDLQVVFWSDNEVIIIWVRGGHQVNVNHCGPLNWVKLAMVRVDEWLVVIDKVIFVVFGRKWFVMFHKAIPVWLSQNFADVV
ncbi:hypothetical protein B7H18_29455 [Pseudomonas putida]|nr:hypothetical protein B7H18_29455 [Pseudomonas putida]